MKIHYGGKYDKDESKLPHREPEAGAVMFKEPEDTKTFSIIANIFALLVFVLLMIPFLIVSRDYVRVGSMGYVWGGLLSLVAIVPHELLHAICFREDVYVYQNLKQAMCFVCGTESMSKAHFIFMSLLPNLVFGLIPFVIFLMHPYMIGVGFFGVACICCGCGDYINVFFALTQMPKGAKTYLSGMHSYWYIP